MKYRNNKFGTQTTCIMPKGSKYKKMPVVKKWLQMAKLKGK